MKELGIAQDSGKVSFGQLYGMCDQVSYLLGINNITRDLANSDNCCNQGLMLMSISIGLKNGLKRMVVMSETHSYMYSSFGGWRLELGKLVHDF